MYLGTNQFNSFLFRSHVRENSKKYFLGTQASTSNSSLWKAERRMFLWKESIECPFCSSYRDKRASRKGSSYRYNSGVVWKQKAAGTTQSSDFLKAYAICILLRGYYKGTEGIIGPGGAHAGSDMEESAKQTG